LAVVRRGQPLVIPPCEIRAQTRKDDEGAVKIVEKPGDGDKDVAKVAGEAGEGAGKAPKVGGGLRRIKAAFKKAFKKL
jgi:hypothetical protein